MALFSQHFRETFRDIFEKFLLALALTACAVLLHFLIAGCQAAHVYQWIILLLECVFAILVLCDGLTIICLATVLLIRIALTTLGELRELFKK
ncbi:MAG: hypothetical protein QOH88_1558 [Verrucomicrobiota bacterium]|jgi:hypothetical protein